MIRSRALTIFLAVTAVGTVTRLAAVWFTVSAGHSKPELPDEAQYWEMAQSLAIGGELRDELGLRATRMPLYPAILRIFVTLPDGRLWVLALQAVLGALACGFSAVLALQVAPQPFSADAAVLAGLTVACDPFLTYFCGLLLTESLFTSACCAFLTLSWPMTVPGRPCGLLRSFGSGLLFGLCVYLRPAAAGLLAAWSVFVLIRRKADRAAILGVGGLWLVLLVTLAPWAARNRSVLGEWVWLTTNMGISLYDGVHPLADGSSDQAAIKRADLGELERDAHFKRQALNCIHSEPARVGRLAMVKFLRTWSFWPNAVDYQAPEIRWTAGLWMGWVLGCALIGMILLRRDAFTLLGLLLPAIYFTILHMFFVGSIRYRLPTMPMLEVISAMGVVSLLSRLRNRTAWSNTGQQPR